MSFLNRLFKKEIKNQDSEKFVDNWDKFFQGIKAIEKRLAAYNKAFYEEGSKKFYTLHYPNPDAEGNTSYCFKEGYRIETESINLTLYPDAYKNGKFGVSITHLKSISANDTESFNNIANRLGSDLRLASNAKQIVKEEHKELSLKELQSYIKDIIKGDRLNLDDIDYTM